MGQKVQYLTFFSYIRRTITKTKGKHHGRHIDEDFEHDCLDGDNGEMGAYDTFDDSNVRKND